MNWKNITLENGFIRQELNLNGSKVVNYIPLCQVDSFGVVSSENKKWLYAGIFMGLCSLVMAIGESFQAMLMFGLFAAGLVGIYFLTRQTWFNITSSQTKFSVLVMTSKEELQAVSSFVDSIKHAICESGKIPMKQAA